MALAVIIVTESLAATVYSTDIGLFSGMRAFVAYTYKIVSAN
jgi:hypothetical protein